MYLCLMIIIWGFESQYLLSYLCIIVAATIYLYSDSYRDTLQPLVYKYFFKDSMKHPLLQTEVLIMKRDDVDQQYYFDKVDYHKLQEQYGIQDIKGFYKQYKDAMKGTAVTLNIVERYMDYLEKYKNLIMWVDKRQTQIISVVLVVAFVIVTFLPLRFFIMIGYIYKFYKGMKWQSKRQTNNMEICKIELVNFFHDNNINFDDVDRKKRKKNR